MCPLYLEMFLLLVADLSDLTEMIQYQAAALHHLGAENHERSCLIAHLPIEGCISTRFIFSVENVLKSVA